MSLNNIKPAKGKLLLSEPMLHETYFKRSVILLTEHGVEGSVGFILNKQIEVKLSEVLSDLENKELPLYLGGPVKKDTLFYIHTLGKLVKESIEILDGLYLGGDFKHIKKLVEERVANESNIRFFIGYSGWNPEQLDTELRDNSWVVANSTPDIIMNKETKNLWRDVLRSMGNEIALLSFFPENPQFN